MGSDLFKNVPQHVSYLFVFLCSCQFLLIFHLGRTHFTAQQHLTEKANPKPYNSVSGESQSVEAVHAGPLNGKLRLLWSMKSGGGNSNEGREANVLPIYHDSLAEKHTSIRQSKQHYPRHNRELPYTRKSDEHGLFLKDFTFHYIINQPFVCHGPDGSNGSEIDEDDLEERGPAPYMIVLVHSHPSHKAQRDAIRDTWGQVHKDYDAMFPTRLVFILGVSELDSDLKVAQKESKMYRDIVLGNFTDTYHNLTLKSLFGIQWALEFCSEVQYVMKTDDDVYFRLPNLIPLLTGLREKIHMLGSLNVNSAVQRHGLWRVSDSEFPYKTYPPYCSGNAYVLSRNILSSLLRAAYKVPLIPIEDVYITGMLANFTDIKCHGTSLFPLWYMGPSPKHMCALLNGRVFGIHNVPYEKMYYIHRKLKAGHICQ